MKRIYKGMCLALSTAMVLSPLSTFALSKDETVYAKLNSNGTIKKIVVSEHLINTEASKTISDMSSLKDIKNVNGDEEFSIDGNNLTWSANGNDIYYQGNSSDNLPIGVKVSYKLNGKEMKVKKMSGKKGHVVITIKYTNNLSNNINGNILYTPFVVAVETSIPTKSNSNVTVTNGKVVSTGTANIVAAISSPGLYESLNANSLKSLDTVTIEYDTTKFSKETIYSVATSKLLDESDFQSLGDINTIYNQVNTLSTSANKILDGSKQLLDGTNKLNNGSLNLIDGVQNAYDGSIKIKNAIDSSIKTAENDTSSALTNEQITYIVSQAKDGAALSDIQKKAISDSAVASIKKNQTYKEIEALISQMETNDGMNENLVNACSTTPVTSGYEDVCAEKKASIAQYKNLEQTITIMEQVASATAIQTAEQTAITTAEKVSTSIAPNIANQVKAAATIKTVKSLKLLSENLDTLSSGLMLLENGTKTLNNGISELNIGASNLYDGVNQFNELGIKKISNLVNGTLKSKINIVKQLAKLSNNYDSYSMKNNDVDGNTKFIMITK